MRHLSNHLLAAATIALTMAMGTTSASAAPPSDGCPRGFVAHTIAEWAALGYPHAPSSVDDPGNGGNGDGVACGRQLGDGTAKQNPSGQVLFEFTDNSLPASS